MAADPNLALLKLQLLFHGIRAGNDLPSPLTNPFGLIHLALPEKVFVSVHLNTNGTESPFMLRKEGDRFLLDIEGKQSVSVGWTPPLKSYQKRTSSGLLVSDILTVHGDFIAVHPSHQCRFGRSGLSCRYCGSSKELSDHPPFTPRDLVEAIHLVMEEKRCDVVSLSSGHVDTPDGGVERLEKWVTEIRKHNNVLISLDLVPPETNDWIDKTYAMGVDALYYDSDFFNPNDESPREFQKHKARQLEALAYAAKIFPTGAVLSHLVVGLESLKDTFESVDLLIDRGVVPVLAYFPPYGGSALRMRWTATPEQVTPIYAHLYERLVRTRINPHWVQQYDVVLTSLEGRFLSPESPRYHLRLKNFYETRTGRAVRFGLASLRRHLRVREVPA
ncbi:MAG TPA: radical SAM protein [Terriglobia bacterium]|nr:radical SAM protein [Terriglobia bacterium]